MRCAMLSGNHALVSNAASSSVLLVSASRQNGCSKKFVKPAIHTKTSNTTPPRNTPNNPPNTQSDQPEPAAFSNLESNLASTPHTINAAMNTSAYDTAIRDASCFSGSNGAMLPANNLLSRNASGQPNNAITS